MLDIKLMASLLNGTMTLAEVDGEFYLTTPVNGGALEIESDGGVYYREWALDHGLTVENRIMTLPDIPNCEVVPYVRAIMMRLEVHAEKHTDDYKIGEACRKAVHSGNEISHGTAKTIASQFDDYSTAIHAFTSTGAITDDRLWWKLFGDYYPGMSKEDQLAADMLGTYLVQRRMRGETGAVENWASLRVDNP